MRKLSNTFMHQLTQPQGLLHPLLVRIKNDQTLFLAIRDGYINVYYRGGNLLRVKEKKSGIFETSFDEQYNKTGKHMPISPIMIESQQDTENWVSSFPERKCIMDEFFAAHDKSEREFQQLVARENNNSVISNESEYFVIDIEASYPDLGARFDILAVRWLATHRQHAANCRAVLIEMKYGDGALDGNAGLVKHLEDMDQLIANKKHYTDLLQSMESQFEQLNQLGLLKFNQTKNGSNIRFDPDDKPEVIFLLANHNPRSTKLQSMLDSPAVAAYSQSERFDLRFFVSSFAGYAMHWKCMLPLEEFRKYF